MKKDAIIALGMGGPDSIEAIEPFLKNLLTDREIINFGVGRHLQNFIAGRIAKSRSAKVAPMYEKMGGGSPQYRLTKALMDKLAAEYAKASGTSIDTFIGMCYWRPFIADTVKQFSEADKLNQYRRVYLFPMYPQFSTTTTSPCLNRFVKASAKTPPAGALITFNHYHMFKPYLECLNTRIKEAIAKLNTTADETHLLISAHSIPQAVNDAGDPYAFQVAEQSARLAEMSGVKSYSIAYQSKMGRMRWLSPSTHYELKYLAEKGVRNVIVLAISFINDHIETLIELDDDILPEAAKLGLNIQRVETVNDSDDFVQAIVKLLVES